MKAIASFAVFLSLWAGAALFASTLEAAPTEIKLPAETAKLRSSTLPGYAIATQKCGICHSADYVEYQPPHMTLPQWTAEMTKMQRVYGAPISDEEIKLLGVYFTATYGDAKTVSAADAALEPAVAAVAGPTTADAPPASGKARPDVQALLESNGCLACHAIDRMVFGPAYRDVAAKYKSDRQALAHVSDSIRQGGSGKWGAVPMPSFANLGAEDAKALAEYVLKQ